MDGGQGGALGVRTGNVKLGSPIVRLRILDGEKTEQCPRPSGLSR